MTDAKDPRVTAERMLAMHKHSTYKPEERVVDHAFAYDSQDEGRKYWLAVLQEIKRIKAGVTA